MSHDFDLAVVGGGSGGVRAARVAASLGARVVLVESDRLGGTCVNVGCVPKKLLVYASHFSEDLHDAAGFGWTTEARHDWSALIRAKDAEIARLNEVYAGLLERSGVQLVRGRARITGPHEVTVGERRIDAATILVATGGVPERPPIPGHEHYMVSDAVFTLPERPARLLVIGGGYIGVEMAGIFHGLGSQVTVVHRGTTLLNGFDDEVAAHLTEAVRARGIDVRTDALVSSIQPGIDGFVVGLTSGEEIVVDRVLSAAGRRPATRGLGLEEVGVHLGPRGGVLVDDAYRSSVPSIRAVGDAIDRLALTPVALAEGEWVARQLFGGVPREVPYPLVPTAVFSQPPVGSVGLSEADARAKCGAVRVFRSRFRPMKLTLTDRREQTFMKMIVDAATDRVVGCHVVGPDAAEMVQGVAIAMTAGATKAHFDATIGIHPTAAEELVTLRTWSE